MDIRIPEWGFLFGIFAFLTTASWADELPPEVADLSARYELAIAEADEPLAKLRKSYVERLEKLQTETREAGDLDSLLLIQKEIEQANAGKPGSGSQHRPLAELQEIFHRHASLSGPVVYAKKARIEKAYFDELSGLVSSYTKEGKIEAALELRKMAEASQKRQDSWNLLEEANTSPNDPLAGFDWDKLGELIEAGKLTETARFGGNPQSNATTRDLPDTPSILVGFDLYLGKYGASDETVRRMVPLFKTREKSVVEGLDRANAKGDRKKRVLAKDGYALVGVESHSEAGIRKVKFAFERISGFGTTNRDRYETDWYGDWDGGRVARIDTGSRLAVGLDGWVGLGTGETWLLVLNP